MKPVHWLFPELAQREVRCVHVGPAADSHEDDPLPPDEYVYVELYCDDLKCDCRRVLLQMISKTKPDEALAWITFGWEKERFTATSCRKILNMSVPQFWVISTRKWSNPKWRMRSCFCLKSMSWMSLIACAGDGITECSGRKPPG